MEKLDLRKFNSRELFFVRKQIVRLKEKGMTGHETFTFEPTGVTPNLASAQVGHSESMDTYGIYEHEEDGDLQLTKSMLDTTLKRLLS